MKITLVASVLLLYVPQVVVAASKNGGWLVQDFPPPNGGGAVVSDPDAILSDQHRDSLADLIVNSMEMTTVKVDDNDIPVQMAVVIVEKMNLDSYGSDVNEEVAAEEFARTLHDTWGVGHETSAGGTGVLLFLSVYDRVVYISRGGALDRTLTNGRVDGIIHGIRGPLKQAKYAEGLRQAVGEVVEFLQKGEPTWKERIFLDWFKVENFFIVAWIGAFVSGLWNMQRDRREQRAYAQVASQLSELDRTQAEALQGQYEATSCPICLEHFPSATVGSDDQPIKLLRCGHIFDETCWAEWVNSGHGNVAQCPICKKDVGPPPAAQAPDTSNTSSLVQNIHIAEEDRQQDQDQVIRRFHQERNFRLMRMGSRFPRFITPHQIQRWTSPTYNGSLVRDPGFVQNNPQVVRQAATRRAGGGGTGSRPMSFGGGRSSGGRSGRF